MENIFIVAIYDFEGDIMFSRAFEKEADAGRYAESYQMTGSFAPIILSVPHTGYDSEGRKIYERTQNGQFFHYREDQVLLS
jgi:hypothetical protein